MTTVDPADTDTADTPTTFFGYTPDEWKALVEAARQTLINTARDGRIITASDLAESIGLVPFLPI
jgi:hypothetical protein